MNIGSPGQWVSGDISRFAAELPDRIRTAHKKADEDVSSVGAAHTTPASIPDSSHLVGADLRPALEQIVENVVADDARRGEDLIEEVIDLVVSHRFGQSEIGDEPELHRAVCEQLSTDPVVIAELDGLLQAIARDMAVG